MANRIDGRRLRSQQTRRKMLDAAMKLFVRHGYGLTTIESIAQESGVAVQTIYFSFGNKEQILKELIDLHVAGDDDPVPTLERPQVVEALSLDDPRELVRALAGMTRVINERVVPLLEVLRNAVISSGNGAELWETNKEQRRMVQRRFVEVLAEKGALAEDLDIDRAVDTCYVVLGPEVYHLFVTERGWSPAQWESWVHQDLCGHLLAGR
ncbi:MULTISPECIES: TetR/AcrR family transcriptional regulator [unclassified Streptomyces]|uniref:TetR/AcrR family transcriptional regulator n=1 Tax=unclassified Streptomyces TaxID=2593676 RepID=UPI00278C6EF3|nr:MULTISPECIES: TetR/AcrR family transcriptional regulator [unclassified Streptomyces]